MNIGLQYIRNYHQATVVTKTFLIVRYLTAAFEDVARFVPKKGSILDIGSGHGLFGVILMTKHPHREVTGIEPDAKKIAIASTLTSKIPNLSFIQSLFKPQMVSGTFDAITIIDVLYLLSPAEKVELLTKIKQKLKPTGILLIKTNPKSHSLGFALCYLQEIVSVSLFGHTFSTHNQLFFSSISEYQALFDQAGYTVIKSKPLQTAFYHPHHLFIVTKKKKSHR